MFPAFAWKMTTVGLDLAYYCQLMPQEDVPSARVTRKLTSMTSRVPMSCAHFSTSSAPFSFLSVILIELTSTDDMNVFRAGITYPLIFNPSGVVRVTSSYGSTKSAGVGTSDISTKARVWPENSLIREPEGA